VLGLPTSLWLCESSSQPPPCLRCAILSFKYRPFVVSTLYHRRVILAAFDAQTGLVERLNVKATWLDYLLSTLSISFILIISVGAVALVSPKLNHWLGDYHVLVELVLAMLLYGALTAVFIRSLLRLKPIVSGSYGEDSPVFTYWKLITVVYRLGQGALRPFAPIFLLPVIDALYGAKIGKNVAFGGEINDPYMVVVGDGTTLGTQTIVTGSFTGAGKLTCGRITIGRNVTIGPNTTIFPNTVIDDDAVLIIGSCVMPGTHIPAGETWRGNPARKWTASRSEEALAAAKVD
jgi:serine acetyltransferase